MAEELGFGKEGARGADSLQLEMHPDVWGRA